MLNAYWVSNIPEKSRGACSADLEGSETSTLVVLSHVNIAVTPLASPFSDIRRKNNMKTIGIPSIKLTINSNNRQDERKTTIYRRIKLMNSSNLKHTRVRRIIV